MPSSPSALTGIFLACRTMSQFPPPPAALCIVHSNEAKFIEKQAFSNPIELHGFVIVQHWCVQKMQKVANTVDYNLFTMQKIRDCVKAKKIVCFPLKPVSCHSCLLNDIVHKIYVFIEKYPDFPLSKSI